MTNRLLSIDDLATYLGVSKRTVHWWNTSGTGPRRIRLGRRVGYRPVDVERWLKKREAA